MTPQAELDATVPMRTQFVLKYGSTKRRLRLLGAQMLRVLETMGAMAAVIDQFDQRLTALETKLGVEEADQRDD